MLSRTTQILSPQSDRAWLNTVEGLASRPCFGKVWVCIPDKLPSVWTASHGFLVIPIPGTRRVGNGKGHGEDDESAAMRAVVGDGL